MLPAPTGLKAYTIPTAGDNVQLQWNPMPGAATYRAFYFKGVLSDGGRAAAMSTMHTLRIPPGCQGKFTVAAVDSAGVQGAVSTPAWVTRPYRMLQGPYPVKLNLITFPDLPAPTLTPAAAKVRLEGWLATLRGWTVEDLDFAPTAVVGGWQMADAPISDPKWGGHLNANGLWYQDPSIPGDWPKLPAIDPAYRQNIYVYNGVGEMGHGGGGVLTFGLTTGFTEPVAFYHELCHSEGGAMHCSDLHTGQQIAGYSAPTDLMDVSAGGRWLQRYGNFCLMGVPLDPKYNRFCAYHASLMGLKGNEKREIWQSGIYVADGYELRVMKLGVQYGFYSLDYYLRCIQVRYHLPVLCKQAGGADADIVTVSGPLAVGASWSDGHGVTIKHTTAGIVKVTM